MLRTTLISAPIVMMAALIATPALSSGDDRPIESIHAGAMLMMQEPPDPCLRIKARTAHERCVTRQMNMNATHGTCGGGGGIAPMMRKAGGTQMEMGTNGHCLNPQPLPPG